MIDVYRPIWAEIDRTQLNLNLLEIRNFLKPSVKIMGLIKADAYGHGAVETSKVLVETGIDYLGVASLDEALQLREAGIKCKILILGYTPPTWAQEVIKSNITQTVYYQELAESLSREATKLHKIAKIHIKIDTGMGRIGLIPERALELIEYINKLPNVYIEGIFSHLSCADEKNSQYSKWQFKRFTNLLKKINFKIPIKHIANSAGLLRFREMHLDMVRPGIILYGLYPAKFLQKFIKVNPVMSLKTVIVEIKTLNKGSKIGYGGDYVLKKKGKIATIPIGYADGFNRLLSSKGEVLVGGKRVKICGRICMDFTMIDVTEVPNIKIGDEVVIIGTQGEERITADDIAKITNTINYEVVSLIGKRIKRIYIGHPINGAK